ncbi:MAG: hypothetical protein H8D87_07475 [Deltaproteobacteria bacterium]|uniref:hypothetical protein n=1 Tax=Desulfobacula sp. TaxID=2593537 RepID=UPI0019CC7B29|nr:hypothetical protein [Candidatus Desulfobacula maris]MBL6993259.1 hypothetical protein [Desulfobacula sp.]
MMKIDHDKQYWLISFFLSLVFAQNLLAGPDPVLYEDKAQFENKVGYENKTQFINKVGYENIDNQFGGHLKLEGRAAGYDAGSYFEPVGTHTGLDGLANVRLKDKLILSEKIYFEAHYEIFHKSGETYKNQYNIQKYFPLPAAGVTSEPLNIDKRRLLDLTKTLKQTDDYVLWHRFDRLFFSIKPSWGDIMVGRQAITWGNGFIFNPMDLFNPFAPSDTIRDYKMGDDLVSVRFNSKFSGECNLLYVPRRDVTTGDVDFESSSVAGKFHFFTDNIEMDVMGALHYDEIILGLGGTGYFKNAAWRTDLVWSTLKNGKNKSGYFEFVANIDYSWVWQDKNYYGFIEFYHNGLGKNNYTDAMVDPDIMERIDRGELFALGKNYLSAQIQMELNPLLNIYLSAISNVRDPSTIIQPRVIFSVTQNSNLHFGASISYGKKGSEYGGFLIPGTNYYTNAAPSAYVRFTYYF